MYLLQRRSHNLWSVVDSEHNVCNTSGSESLNLVQYHGLVAEFNERLGQSEGLEGVRVDLDTALML